MPPEARPARDTAVPLRILYLGRLDREQKRVHLFPAILEQLQSSGIPFHWTLAGDGPESAALQARMQGGGPEQIVSFIGTVPYADVPRILSEHDVFLLASDYEGLPLSLLEAMGAGLAPVVSDLPSGIRELVDETTGKRVAPGNLRGYAEAIVWLHEHRGELRRFSENAQRRVRGEFSIAAMAGRWGSPGPTIGASNLRCRCNISSGFPALDELSGGWFSSFAAPRRHDPRHKRSDPVSGAVSVRPMLDRCDALSVRTVLCPRRAHCSPPSGPRPSSPS
jgi:hypothetical protein